MKENKVHSAKTELLSKELVNQVVDGKTLPVTFNEIENQSIPGNISEQKIIKPIFKSALISTSLKLPRIEIREPKLL
ncbi:MAG: hypothetical protein JSW07_07725, partial [bacterium]